MVADPPTSGEYEFCSVSSMVGAPPNECESAAELLLIELAKKHDFNIADENFIDTPRRVAKSYEELLSGYNEKPTEILSKSFPASKYDQMIACTGIDFFSLCSHHMLPFFGKASVAYLPGDEGKVVGISKLARVVHAYARRFQIQERMTQQIACAVNDNLDVRGVGVVVAAEHFCMKMRGVKQPSSLMTTSCLLGEFREDPSVRSEFFSLIK